MLLQILSMVACLPMYLLAETITFLAVGAFADVDADKPQSSSLMRVHDVKLKPRIALEHRTSYMMRLDQSAGLVATNGTSNVSTSTSSSWSSASAAVDGDGEAVLLTLPRVDKRSARQTGDPFVPVHEVPIVPKPVQQTVQPPISDCPPPAAYRRGCLIAGLFFFAMGLVAFKREAWWRCTEHAEARGSLDMWSSGRWSTTAGAAFAMMALTEVALHMYGLHVYGHGLSVHGLMEAKNAMTCAFLSLAAWMDPVIRRHQPIQANRILCCLLAVTSILEVIWLSTHGPDHLVALNQMFKYLKLTAFFSALVLCLQAFFPSSNLRCAACFLLMLHGSFYMDIAGHWLWKEEGAGCSQSEDAQYMAADLHGKVITAAVASWFVVGLFVSYIWAVHVQKSTRAECKALMRAASVSNHE